MPKLISVSNERFKCSACEQMFALPPLPRGARPWTPEEALVKLATQFKEHLAMAHLSPSTKDVTIAARAETNLDTTMQVSKAI